MPHSVKILGQTLRKTRLELKLKLVDVKNDTQISVATLSRIERAAFDGSSTSIRSDTLTKLSEWIEEKSATAGSRDGSTSTPDLVSLHLRADKSLDAETADALALLFKTAYDGFTKDAKK